MLICSIKVSDVMDEKSAGILADSLLDVVDEVSSMSNRWQRNKKIARLSAKMEHFRKRCVRKGWQKPLDQLKEAFEIIEESKDEMEGFKNLLFTASR